MAQQRQNVDLAASNTTLRKANTELGDSNKELDDNHAKLVKENAKLVGQEDVVKEELVVEKAKNTTLKAELESTLKKMQFIVVDAILHARVKLMGEFKRGKHANWDPD